jgi:hypothetical protein
MIPLAVRLSEPGNTIIIGAGEKHLALFRKEVPELRLINFPGFKPGYSRYLPQYLVLLIQTPLLLYHIIKEHNKLKKIIREFDIDIVISDNRFGLWNKNVKTVYVTHMPVIPFPGAFLPLEFVGILLHRAIIKKYDFCFIPDLPGEMNVSGRLSHSVKLPGNTRFIGILSRFSDTTGSAYSSTIQFPHNTVILSGPEPQRGILREKIAGILKKKDIPAVFLGINLDKPESEEHSENMIFYNHPGCLEMEGIIKGSESIITRSGYSTIMELISLNCSALLIPTPGQTEQEYLAKYLEAKGWFRSVSQKRLTDGIVLPSIKPGWPEEINIHSRGLLTKALRELLEE